MIVPVPQAAPPVPPVEVTVTVNGVVPAGVEPVVTTVNVDDGATLVMAGEMFAVTPVGALGFQLI